jgi:hypothetical protein
MTSHIDKRYLDGLNLSAGLQAHFRDLVKSRNKANIGSLT